MFTKTSSKLAVLNIAVASVLVGCASTATMQDTVVNSDNTHHHANHSHEHRHSHNQGHSHTHEHNHTHSHEDRHNPKHSHSHEDGHEHSHGLSVSQIVSQGQGYRFPAEIYEGYWAMAEPLHGEAVVISFKPGKAENYRFRCTADGGFQQIDVETSQLVPTKTGMALVYDTEQVLSELTLVQIEPKQTLALSQSFIVPELREAMPEGIVFSYRYTPTLKPLCD